VTFQPAVLELILISEQDRDRVNDPRARARCGRRIGVDAEGSALTE